MEKLLKHLLDKYPILVYPLGAAVIGTLFYIFYFGILRQRELGNNSRYTIATIIRTFYRVGPSSSHDCEFTYKVNGERYTGTDRYHVEDENQANYLIRFALVNPKNCELLGDYPVYDANLAVPAVGWAQIPNAIVSLKKPRSWGETLLMVLVYGLFALIIGYMAYKGVREIQLARNHRFAVAFVEEVKPFITQDNEQAYRFYYEFSVNEQVFRKEAFKQSCQEILVGKRYWVKFYPRQPTNAEFLADKPVEPIPAETLSEGWEKIPA